MIRPKIQTQDLLFSITKNCETLMKQTHAKRQETPEFKMTKPRETFHFNPPIQIKEDWIIGLTDLDVYNSIFNLTEDKKNSDFKNFLMKKAVVSHTQKSEMRLKETWIFQLLQLPIYKMK